MMRRVLKRAAGRRAPPPSQPSGAAFGLQQARFAVPVACFALGGLVVAAVALPRPGRAAASAPVVARQAVAGAASTSAMAHTTVRASFLGGTYVTANGASVRVRVSESFPDAEDRGRRWAEFFSTLPHGNELATVSITVVTATELQGTCGGDALGCYRTGEITIADASINGVLPEEVARHEYGHHVAASRLNPPWAAIDWGPKRWATAAHICGDQAQGLAFPGDEGAHYVENPGEAWAEAYRILAERAAGLPGMQWSIVVGRYYPDQAALAAAENDVVNPWTAPSTRRYRGLFVRGGARIWQRLLVTPLDGRIEITLSMPVGPRHDVKLFDADGRTVVARWTNWTSRTRTIVTTICGKRSVLVRVSRGAAPGPFTVSATYP